MIKPSKSATVDRASKIIDRFLNDIDKIIRLNSQTMKCSEIAKIYFDLFEKLKNFKGNSIGFTGFSEFLIFRFLFHMLDDGSFEMQWIKKGSTAQFVSEKRRIRIAQGIVPITKISGKKCNPDVLVFKDNLLKAVIQIKVYLTKGKEEIIKEMKTLREIKDLNPETRAMLLIFDLSYKGDVFHELRKQRNKNREWFTFIVLKKNNTLLSECLVKKMGFDRI